MALEHVHIFRMHILVIYNKKPGQKSENGLFKWMLLEFFFVRSGTPSIVLGNLFKADV